jgi:hypothetical protein
MVSVERQSIGRYVTNDTSLLRGSTLGSYRSMIGGESVYARTANPSSQGEIWCWPLPTRTAARTLIQKSKKDMTTFESRGQVDLVLSAGGLA